jgi:hypothetical protein
MHTPMDFNGSETFFIGGEIKTRLINPLSSSIFRFRTNVHGEQNIEAVPLQEGIKIKKYEEN